MERTLNQNLKLELPALYRGILGHARVYFTSEEIADTRRMLVDLLKEGKLQHADAIHQPIVKLMNVIYILLDEMSLGKTAVNGVLAFTLVSEGVMPREEVKGRYGASVAGIVEGLERVHELYERGVSVETENFRKLLLSFAQDLRVILIVLADRLFVMRNLSDYPEDDRRSVAKEVAFLYAPLAHRLGLYSIKTVLEDLALKYTNHEIYADIARKLNETKRSRDAYIKEFIVPLKKRLEDAGFDFEIKGRTKSIHSIYNKIVKKKTPFEDIYDLFAIRIILNSPLEKEKSECWQVYSIVADMYQPNPSRMRDWLSIPKSNGYESLHTTVMGPQGKWVEVQIRTRRMDEVAEKGLAAHWKYKGVQSEANMDNWLKGIREILENPEMSAMDFMDNFKLNLYDDEVFVFTPNGDLHKLPKGATVLDFAFEIHTKLGAQCIGAILNGKNVPMKHVLCNGDQIQILTSQAQSPKQEWLNIVMTSRAKTKIRQALKESQSKDAEIGRETLKRRLKNWKIDFDEAKVMRLVKKMGYKSVTDMYVDVALEKLDVLAFRDEYLELDKPVTQEETPASAENFIQKENQSPLAAKDDVLVIDQNLKDIDFTLAKCCHPIYGDEVFGFVSSQGGVKIHRMDCPNAPLLISKFGYRVVKACWAGKAGSRYAVTLRVVASDDIGIVTNVTSIISKEPQTALRSINVDSSDGIFIGTITIFVTDTNNLKSLIKKIKTIKGVKSVERTGA